jgi:hypothetical protein
MDLEFWLRASVWLSLVSWAAAECLRLGPRDRSKAEAAARGLWAASCFLAFVHVALAFELRHGWSHAAAVADTARQTRELLGVSFGGGVFANYAFLAVFALDALWWWRSPATYRDRALALDVAIRFFLFFMYVNGAIVFARGPVRAAGLLCVLAVAIAAARGRSYSVTSNPPSGPERESPPTHTRNSPGSTT